MILLLSAAFARPTESGLYSFSADDVVVYVDSADGRARVYYSEEGPNQVKQGDVDGNGVPDFAETVGVYISDVLSYYEAAGFRTIPADDGRGGSDAMDAYLVDFAGNADGQYTPEACSDGVCSGYFVMENDFAGYGYSSDASAISTLTSHELFHGIQDAYSDDEEVWYVEGTATWAERFYDPDSEDFLWFCDSYLEDTARSLDEPPSGPVPAFAYATALWWWFVTNRYGDAWMVDYLDATATGDDLLVSLDERTDLAVDFVEFAEWNLATGANANGTGYPFADEIGPVKFEDRAASLDDDNRFYPLGTTYYVLEHEGGPVQFALEEDAPDVVFELWADTGDGVGELVAAPASTAGLQELGELPAGDYFFFGVNPTLADESTKVRFCLGPDASACVPEEVPDTGDKDTATTEEPSGCGCSTGSGLSWIGAVAVLFGIRRRGV